MDIEPIMLKSETGIPNLQYMILMAGIPMPFLVQGGAYHEPADYTVEIEAPAGYRIAAGTGRGYH